MPETAGSSGGGKGSNSFTRLFFLGAAAVVLVLAFGFGAAANTSVFCTGCHDGQKGKDSLTASSHTNFDCLKCHGGSVLSNTGDLARRTVKQLTGAYPNPVTAVGLVNDQKCLSCHTLKKVSPSGDIRIEHSPHTQKNVSCTQCHNRVAHPSTPDDTKTVAFVDKLKMSNCGTCHDNKTAPSTCSTCHKSDRTPSTHKDVAWVRAHGKSALGGDMGSCLTCHSWNQSFCQSCHTTIKPTSHTDLWVRGHKTEVQNSRDGCDFCHKPPKDAQGVQTVSTAPSQSADFCTKCHTTIKPTSHDATWVGVHKTSRAANPASCDFCHTPAPGQTGPFSVSQQPDFCVKCHTAIKPGSHNAMWLGTHKTARAANPASCEFCHAPKPGQTGPLAVSQQPDFCNKCHTTIKPASHDATWIGMHKVSRAANPASCEFCHKPPPGATGGQVAVSQGADFCTKCHGTIKPASHTANWVHSHKPEVLKNSASCEFCHGNIATNDFCSSCHTKVKPDSHEVSWVRVHKNQVAMDRSGCDFCHKAKEGKVAAASQSSDFCTKCHGTIKAASHDTTWVRAHGKQAAQSRSSCDFCHKAPPGTSATAVPASQNPDFCNTCHKTTRPVSHDQTWWREHGPTMVKDNVGCIQCHATNNAVCQTCHKIIRPSSHDAKFVTAHGQQALKEMQTCQLCHGTNLSFCQQCHKNVRPTSHDQNWRGTHKDSAKANLQSCTVCHDPQSFCNNCHIFPLPQKQ